VAILWCLVSKYASIAYRRFVIIGGNRGLCASEHAGKGVS